MSLLPSLVAHADWSTAPAKQWIALARWQEGRYVADRARPVGVAANLLQSLREHVSANDCILVGFDFPIGMPVSYARSLDTPSFLELLPLLGSGEWSEFFDVCRAKEEISVHRPFFPRGCVGVRREHLLTGIGIESWQRLLRRCERRGATGSDACALFWTLGGNQVGRAAINGWREVLVPGLKEPDLALRLWPFHGDLGELIADGATIVAETYPAEFYAHLGVVFGRALSGGKSGKRVRSDRAANAGRLLAWAQENEVVLTDALGAEIQDGFGDGPDGEDRFDAVVGLFGMLNVLLGRRPEGAPRDVSVRQIEGWILGKRP